MPTVAWATPHSAVVQLGGCWGIEPEAFAEAASTEFRAHTLLKIRALGSWR
jgi:hypothetical protein